MLAESLSTPCAQLPHNVDRRSRETAKAPHRPSHRAPLSTATATNFNFVQPVMPSPRLVLWDTILGQTKKEARSIPTPPSIPDAGAPDSGGSIDASPVCAYYGQGCSVATPCCGTPCVNSSMAACTASDLDCVCFSSE
jgi:hypothetical protein